MCLKGCIPKAPMLDAGQWVDAHFKQVGGCVLVPVHLAL
jgi:hypothetical protein